MNFLCSFAVKFIQNIYFINKAEWIYVIIVFYVFICLSLCYFYTFSSFIHPLSTVSCTLYSN